MKNITVSVELKGNKKEKVLPAKQAFLKGLKEAVNEVNLIIEGKKKGLPAEDLFNE